MSSEPPPAEPSEASASPPKVSPGGAGAAPPGPAAHETNTLWVGNLPTHAGEDDVMAAFAPHGALDCALSRAGARSYAFVLFRSVAESRAALEALRGSRVKGSAIRIEFARPARAVRNLWIGGISPAISKQELQEEFQKFGKIEGVAFSRDQTSAYIDFEKLEDAISAHRALNGTDLGGKELCVDFQRSRGRAERSEAGNFNSRGSVPPGEMGGGHVKASAGVRAREADRSNVLWVGFPNTHKLNEEALRRAMAAHGVVTNIKVFPERQYAFVEFATIEGAFKAKNLLDGRLFNDNRIHVVFSNSGLAPSKLDNLTPPAGLPGSDTYSDSPFAAPDYFGPGRATSQGYDPRHGRSGYLDYGAVPVPGGILPAPEHGSSFSTGRSAQNAFDPRDAKRTRMDGGADRYYVRAGSEAVHPVRFAHQDGVALAEESLSPVIRIQGTVHQISSFGHFWRGSIAKGGSPVCRARCLPIKKGIEIPLPDVVNCSARTGLDMLAKHYGDASGFDIVFFLPDSEDDFVSYTEFLRYLGSKSRAGVVKVDSGTTLFLVPPSDFLTNVLQVDGPERLYGVVLHIPQMSTAAVQRPLLTGPESQPYYGMVSSNDNHHQDGQYRGSLREEAVQSSLSSFPMNQIAGHQAQASLKPDIMATLAQLMPNVQSAVPATGQMGSLQQPGQQASAAHLRSYGGMAGAQEQLTQHTAYNPEMTLNLPPPPPVPSHAPNSAMASSVGGHSLPTQMNQQQYQPEPYYASQNNYGSVGSHSNLPLPPPPQVNNGPLANNQVGANQNFSSQAQQQQNVASASSQAPDEADKNKKYQATLQFAHNLLLQLQRGSGNQP
ncbi:flowering time control protein FPA-like [Lolium rigidum]|uniref:flowering time control protein FPA-like n=1 Tax=Lolium rigidum TaxID=89674 RepID=UPI001F5CFD6D|nr:flowering time control protein FPA-like [Lolium rigidum]